MVRKAWIAIALCAVALLPAAASDSETHGSLSPNVLLTITVREGNDAEARSYRMFVRGDNSRARLVTGWRVPIPMATSGTEGDGSARGTAITYSYQNIGLTADVRARVLPDNQVELQGQIEVSGAKEPIRDSTGTPHAPTIGTFEQSFSVLLHERRPLELSAVASPEGGSLSIRLEAEVLD